MKREILIDAEKRIDVLRPQLLGHALQNIHVYLTWTKRGFFIFYRALPKQRYVLPNADVRLQLMGRGTKAFTSKDRVTLVLCCNATGSFKVAPLMIGTSKNSRCFKKQIKATVSIYLTFQWRTL